MKQNFHTPLYGAAVLRAIMSMAAAAERGETKAEDDAANACAKRTATLRGDSARIHRVMLAIIAGRKLMPT